MTARTSYLFVAAALVTIGYEMSLFNQDSLPKAADRFGRAIMAKDTKTIWTMLPDSERDLYRLDQTKFDVFWSKVVQPHLKNLDQYEIESENDNGLRVVCQSSKTGDRGPCFTLLISGQLGQYYSPYMIAYSSLGTAKLDSPKVNVRKSEKFAQYVKWINDNEALLSSIGITKMKRGPAYPTESLNEIKRRFQKNLVEEKKLEESRLKLATR